MHRTALGQTLPSSGQITFFPAAVVAQHQRHGLVVAEQCCKFVQTEHALPL